MGRIHAAGMAADQRFRHRLELQAKMAFRARAACVKSSFFHSKTKAVQTYCTLVDQGTCALKQLPFPPAFRLPRRRAGGQLGALHHRVLRAAAAGPQPRPLPQEREQNRSTQHAAHIHIVFPGACNPCTKAWLRPFPCCKTQPHPQHYTMFAGTTQASNSSPVTKPDASAAPRRLRPCWCARLAICAALS